LRPLSVGRVTNGIVGEVLEDGMATVILLIPKRGHYDWTARELATDSGSSVLTYKELMTALNSKDPRPFVDKNVDFATRTLRQHSKVHGLRMICESSFVLIRKEPLPSLTVAVDYQYEFTQEALVAAVERHPDARIFLNANPNGRPTSAAVGHGEFAGVEVHRIGELMSRLNRA
jgi:hypothetical protein